MTPSDPQTCRRALREIAEIAAVARLQDSRMSPQDALAAIAAIAGWVEDEAPRSVAACGDVIASINALTGGADIDDLTDRDAIDLFSRVARTLQRRV
ncbi:MAG: hypothetical protein REJ23_01640 [Brevundimonas sp.]|nr:hypothetical protein [Brevundimonas sp.]